MIYERNDCLKKCFPERANNCPSKLILSKKSFYLKICARHSLRQTKLKRNSFTTNCFAAVDVDRSCQDVAEYYWVFYDHCSPQELQYYLLNFTREQSIISRVARWHMYFQTRNPDLGKFWRVLQWTMLV
jgi:hypothetical protein